MAANNLSFKDMYTEVQNFLQDSSATLLTVIKAELNRSYERLTSAVDWEELWFNKGLDDTFQVTAGEAYLALPVDCAHVKEVYNKSTNVSYLPQSMKHLARANINTIDTQGAIRGFFAVQSKSAIKAPIPDAGEDLEISSSQAGDTSLSVRMFYTRKASTIPEVVSQNTDASNGTTQVSIGNTVKSGWSVEAFSIDAAHSGVIRITDSTPTVTYAEIPPGEKQSIYTILRFENPPDNADSIWVTYKKRVQHLTADNDVCIIPELSRVCIEEAKASIRQYDKKYQQAEVHKGQAGDMMRAILAERNLQAPHVRQARPVFQRRTHRRAYN
jgi:hypothetical protein